MKENVNLFLAHKNANILSQVTRATLKRTLLPTGRKQEEEDGSIELLQCIFSLDMHIALVSYSFSHALFAFCVRPLNATTTCLNIPVVASFFLTGGWTNVEWVTDSLGKRMEGVNDLSLQLGEERWTNGLKDTIKSVSSQSEMRSKPKPLWLQQTLKKTRGKHTHIHE